MRKLKYGVIGCAGRMGMAHLLFLNNVVADRVRVVALAAERSIKENRIVCVDEI